MFLGFLVEGVHGVVVCGVSVCDGFHGGPVGSGFVEAFGCEEGDVVCGPVAEDLYGVVSFVGEDEVSVVGDDDGFPDVFADVWELAA